MAKLKATNRALLSKLLADGHSKFGYVVPRRPYKEDDSSGDGGAASFLPDHPLLAQQPIGAASDLTFIANQNSESIDNAENRGDELCNKLQKSLTNVLGNKARHVAVPNPFGSKG